MKLASLLLLLTLTACATPSQVTETYRAADLDSTTFDKVLIVGIAGSANTRRLFEDALVADLGDNAVVSYREIRRIDAINRDTVVAAARAAGADAVLVTRIKDAQTRAKSSGARTEVAAQRKDDRMVDFFRYDYAETTDPASIRLLTTVVLSSDLYRGSDEQRVYAFESTAFDRETVPEIVDELSSTIASRLKRSGLIN